MQSPVREKPKTNPSTRTTPRWPLALPACILCHAKIRARRIVSVEDGFLLLPHLPHNPFGVLSAEGQFCIVLGHAIVIRQELHKTVTGMTPCRTFRFEECGIYTDGTSTTLCLMRIWTVAAGATCAPSP